MGFWIPENAHRLQQKEYFRFFLRYRYLLSLLEINYLARKIHVFISRYNITCKKSQLGEAPEKEINHPVQSELQNLMPRAELSRVPPST